MAKYLRRECGDLNEVASDNDDDKDGDDDDDDDDDDANSKDVEVAEIGNGETLAMLGRLANLRDISKKNRNSPVAMKDYLKKTIGAEQKAKPHQ